MTKPSDCPQMDALVMRHNELRRAEDLGRHLAAQTGEMYAAAMARMRSNLAALEATPDKSAGIMARFTGRAEPLPFDHDAFTRFLNDPLGLRAKGADLG